MIDQTLIDQVTARARVAADNLTGLLEHVKAFAEAAEQERVALKTISAEVETLKASHAIESTKAEKHKLALDADLVAYQMRANAAITAERERADAAIAPIRAEIVEMHAALEAAKKAVAARVDALGKEEALAAGKVAKLTSELEALRNRLAAV